MDTIQAIHTENSSLIETVQTKTIVMLKASLILLTIFQNSIDFQA